jgi:hypothetical protein
VILAAMSMTLAPAAAWQKLSTRIGELLDGSGSDSRSAASKAAVVGRLLGKSVSADGNVETLALPA